MTGLLDSMSTILKKKYITSLGLISGTSVDGVDVALAHVGHAEGPLNLEIVGHATHPYPAELRGRIEILSDEGGGSADEICRLNFEIGAFFSDAALALLKQLGKRGADGEVLSLRLEAGPRAIRGQLAQDRREVDPEAHEQLRDRRDQIVAAQSAVGVQLRKP